MPAAFNDVIHDAWAGVIFPTDKTDSSEVSKKIAGLDQPVIMPMRNPINETMCEWFRKKWNSQQQQRTVHFRYILLAKIQKNLPTKVAKYCAFACSSFILSWLTL